jgi:glycosyltransferase involved in cell wall biosynthesis
MIHYSNPDWVPPVINEMRVLAEADYFVDMVCRDYLRTWDICYPESARIVRLRRRDGQSTMSEYLWFIIRSVWLSNPSAKVVIGHDMHGFVAARMVAWFRRCHLVYQCHDFVEAGTATTRGARLVKRLEELFARTADAVVVPDADRAVVIANQLRLRRPPIILPNSPMRNSIPGTSRLQATLAGSGFTFDRVVLRQGKIGPGHAIEATIRSLAHWACDTWGLVLIGDGPVEYIQRYRALAADLGFADRVVILPPVSYDDILDFTVGADAGSALYEPIHVNHRHMTTASNKLLEYLACGTPTILSDTPAMQGFLATYGCGITADESDPASIAAAVNAILGDEKAASRMSTAAREAYLNTFAYDLQAGSLLGLLHTLIERGPGECPPST